MVTSSIICCALLFVSLAKFNEAAVFLPARAQVAREDVKQFLLSELSGRADTPRLGSMEEELRAMYVALPKSKTGRLEPPTVRYALHRYFVQKHGWYVKGLDTGGDGWNSPTSSTILKARTPAYIQSLFEEHLRGVGLGLHELAVFAATLEDLIHAEAAGHLEWIYAALRLPSVGPLTRGESDSASHYFVIAYLSRMDVLLSHMDVFPKNKLELENMEVTLRQEKPDLPETLLWVQDLRQTHELESAPRRNPFVEYRPDFDSSYAFALEFGHRFGSFQNLECQMLKGKLVDMEHLGTGRVLLSTFYSRALAGAWEFMESIEYLRNQGALDETNPARPSVVIPNYINSKANCLAGSEFYSVCCINECEGLLAQVEQQIASPSAESVLIAKVISALPSDTVDAPRNLSKVLRNRLDEIAHFHGGQIPLHGRLFAQWMHHAYPRECSFPHVSGTASPLSQVEWAEKMGVELLEASRDVMKKHASRANTTLEISDALPWTFEEELVAENRQTTAYSRGFTFLPSLAALAALVSFAVPVVRACKNAIVNPEDNKLERHLV